MIALPLGKIYGVGRCAWFNEIADRPLPPQEIPSVMGKRCRARLGLVCKGGPNETNYVGVGGRYLQGGVGRADCMRGV